MVRVRRKLGLLLGLVIVGGIAVFAYSQYHAALQTGELGLAPVTVSGTARTLGTLKTPIRVDFGACIYNYCYRCDSDSTWCHGCSLGQVCYTSQHSASVENSRYSTELENHYTYDVFLVFVGQGVQSSCYAGPVTINTGLSGKYTYDVSC